MPNDPILNFGTPGREWRLATQEGARQAIPPIRGYTYQFHRTAEAWINLPEGHTLYLEVAEDFAEIVRKPGQIDEILNATQVKHTRESGSITLNSEDVLDAIRKLFEFQLANPGRRVTLNFLTTSPVGQEKKNSLPSGLPGIEAWRAAGDGGDVVEVREALLTRFPDGPLNGFLESSTADELRDRLLSALTFSCDADDWVELERRNREELVRRRKEVDASREMAERAYDAIISEVVRTINTPGTRALDRQNFLDSFSRASNYGVPSQVALDMVAALSRGERVPSHQSDNVSLKNLAKSLLETGAPPNVPALFPDAARSSVDAWRFISILERFVVDPNATEVGGGSQQKLTLRALVKAEHRKHLITSPPGNGKSFSVWRLAAELLAGSDVVPLFLPIGRLDKWQKVLKIISDLNPSCDPASVLRDSRVCVLLDGWSEFASGEHLEERAEALHVLDGARVIANARQADLGDTVFKEWSLERLPPDSVLQAIKLARPSGSLPAPEALDLLRLPLLLSLFLLSESAATQTGQLLRQFQNHVAKRLPERFTEALCVAASRVALASDNSHQGLVAELQHCAAERGIADPGNSLQQLGTIGNRRGQVASLHDLYWSWLVGCGLLIDNQVALAASHIAIKESLTLALQSGQRVEPATIARAAALDVVLAAEIDASWRAPVPHADLAAAIEKGLADERLSVRSRAGIAGVESRRPQFLRSSLDTFSEMSIAKFYMPEWVAAFSLKDLYDNRSALADWIGCPGGNAVLEVIAKSGGPEWLPWLEQMAAENRVNPGEALATALACAPTIPDWGLQHIDALAKTTPWEFRSAAARAANLHLAHWVATNYDGIVGSRPPGSGAWFHLNKVLVACGDNGTFQSLLDQFGTMCSQAQERLCYAVSDVGDPWISKFQTVAFASRKKTKMNPFEKLSDLLGDHVDDDTARQWIADGYDQEGWRVLIAHHGNHMVPELIAELPDSFSDQHYISALANMRHLQDAPKEIIPEIMGRVRGNMTPMATEHVLKALATVKLQGMIVIVDWMARHAQSMPAYHIRRSLELYSAWKKSTSQDILVATAQGTMPYPIWIVANTATAAWEGHFTAQMLASQPDFAIDFAIKQLDEDDVKAEEVLKQVKGVRSYNARLFERMIRTPRLAALIVEMSAGCLDTFPAPALLQLVSSEDVNYDMLIFRLSTTSNIMHRPVHAELIKREVSGDTNLHHCRYLGNMLRSYNRHEAMQLLKETTSPSEDRSIWLVREVETARKQRLLDESQQWIQ